MKQRFLFILIVSALCLSSITAQKFATYTEPIKVKYPAIITYFRPDRLPKNLISQQGSIFSTDDFSIVFAKTDTVFHPNITPTEVILATDIYEIQVQQKKTRRGTIAIGGGMGMLVGGVIAYGNGEPGNDYLTGGSDGAWVRASAGAIGGGCIGAGLGGIASAFSKRTIKTSIPILGNQDAYIAQREKLKRLSISGQ